LLKTASWQLSPTSFDVDEPVLAILLPAARRDVHLRACVILGARFGQLGLRSERECHFAPISEAPAELQQHSGVIVAKSDELGPIALPSEVKARLAGLQSGQGLLAEFITDAKAGSQRWFLASGADDHGVEKALLTLGSTESLNLAPRSPAVIAEAPTLSPALEAQATTDIPRIRNLDQIDETLVPSLAGNLAAVDALGRTASYDLHTVALESFAERVQRRIPRNLGWEETRRHLSDQAGQAEQVSRSNHRTIWTGGLLVILITGARGYLLWERARASSAAAEPPRPGIRENWG
jgi:hypothetical protein